MVPTCRDFARDSPRFESGEEEVSEKTKRGEARCLPLCFCLLRFTFYALRFALIESIGDGLLQRHRVSYRPRRCKCFLA